MIRNFFIRLALVILPFTVSVALVNYFVDPANIFSAGTYLNGIAGILSQGHNVDNVSNYDERLLQEELVKHLKQRPEIVVLGSSRIMEVGSELFPGKKLLNCGVSHANIKDIIAITGLLDSLQRLPAELILNVDDGLLGKNYTEEWESIRVYYDYFFSHYTDPKIDIRSSFAVNKKLFSIFSVSYFQASMQFLMKKKQKKYADVGENFPESEGRLADGTIFYSYEYTHGDVARIAQVAAETGRKFGVASMDPDQEKLFSYLLDFFQKKGIAVKLCLMPYHPAYYSSVNEYHRQIFVDYENYYSNLAQKRGLAIVGSFDPAVKNISDTMFYDMYHCSRTAIKKIFTQ